MGFLIFIFLLYLGFSVLSPIDESLFFLIYLSLCTYFD